MKRILEKATLYWLLVFSLLCSNASYAENLKFVAFQYPPLVYQENGEVIGVATELVRAVFKQIGVPIEIEILPWARSLQYLQSGQADGVFTIFKNPQRQTFLLYPDEPLIEQTISLYTAQDRPINYSDKLSDLAPYRIGLTRAVSYGERFDAAIGSSLTKLTVVNDEQTKFMLLAKGRVDVVVSSVGIAEFYLEKLQLQHQIRRIPTEIQRVPSFLAFAKTAANQMQLERFEQALKQLKQSGRYDQIIKSATQPEIAH
ncbi:MAG: transporter substrate-binding domain-containing protein [Halopseudomonas sp.]